MTELDHSEASKNCSR